MDIPTSTAAVAVLVALFVPGLVYSTIRASLTGYRGTDRSLGSRFAHAVTVGVVLNAAYLALFGRVAYESFGFDAGREQVVVADPVGAGRTILLLGLVAPAVLAALAHAVPWWRIPGAQRIMDWASAQGLLVVNRVPTAWDHAGHQQNGVFVRVTRADGTIVGGFYGKGSFMSGYPEHRDIFIAQQWRVTANGRFDHVLENSAGMWIAVRDDDILEWTRPEEDSA
ncbi:DUF6338 family protein [uncultured Amnibacterium sp.]|uniref:DUF6338 family protein n=1 Tax=uncultured Amnibacterium sp. TaxID=1631851 RepID=UPI0035CB4060